MGMAFEVHFCGNKVASVTVSIHEKASDQAVSCCGVKAIKSKCCKDKRVQFQKKSDHFASKTVAFAPCVFDFQNEFQRKRFKVVDCFSVKPITSYYFDANAPPFFKLYHQYLFYA
jgi:hypothetical protein